MTSLQIRKLPQDVYGALSHRAAREGRSLAQQAIVELRKVSELDGRNRRLATIERLREQPRIQLSRMPEELIREDRDR